MNGRVLCEGASGREITSLIEIVTMQFARKIQKQEKLKCPKVTSNAAIVN